MVDFFMKDEQLNRQWLILRKIEASKTGLTAAEIAETTGGSLRTAYREFDDLQFVAFPIYPGKGEGGN